MTATEQHHASPQIARTAREETTVAEMAGPTAQDLLAQMAHRDANLKRLGIVRIALEDLGRVLELPESYDVTGVWFDPASRSLNVEVRNDQLNVVAATAHPPVIGRLSGSQRYEEI